MPIFETEADRRNEARIAKMFGDRYGLRVQMTGTLSGVDFYAYAGKDELVYVGEVKCRTVKVSQYGAAYFDNEKAEKVRSVAAEYGAKGVVVLSYSDGVYAAGVDQVLQCPTTVSKRTDRGNHDRAQSAHKIPVEALQRIA